MILTNYLHDSFTSFWISYKLFLSPHTDQNGLKNFRHSQVPWLQALSLQPFTNSQLKLWWQPEVDILETKVESAHWYHQGTIPAPSQYLPTGTWSLQNHHLFTPVKYPRLSGIISGLIKHKDFFLYLIFLGATIGTSCLWAKGQLSSVCWEWSCGRSNTEFFCVILLTSVTKNIRKKKNLSKTNKKHT